jgi:16S rRNA (cytosine967-C5)-methyltransferase
MQLSSLLGHVQELLGNIRASSKPADSLMDAFFRSHKYLGSHDRRFIAETTYGTLRHLRRCEFIVQSAIGANAENVSREDGLMLLPIAYLAAIDRRPLTAADVSSQLSSMALKKGMVAILKTLSDGVSIPQKEVAEQIGIEYSYPDWMIRRMLYEYGHEETEKICKSLNEPAPLTLRVNLLKTTVEQCQEELKKQEIEGSRTATSPYGLQITKRINVFSLQAFQDGFFEVQDEGSQILPLLIDPKPTAKVLDACAGAGGKTLGFAAIMKNRGEIFATDTNGYRLKELKKRSRRAGAFNIRPLEVASIGDLPDKFHDYFDVVFVDAPCSGLGTIRRNPGMKWTVTEETVKEVSEKQSEILRQCAPLVKPGGRLVYATCTLLRQENEDVVKQFVEANPGFGFVNPERMLEKIGLKQASSGNFIKLLPHIHSTDGFFCAVLERISRTL